MRVVPLTQPERDNPLMRGYFLEIGLPGKRLARRCGVSHSQIYMARKRTVGADNARKIARGVASILGLSERERLQLVAEIMGHPGDVVRAWCGDPTEAARLLGIPMNAAREIVNEEKSITNASGTQALAKLREMGAPEIVVGSVEGRLMPPPERPRGIITHDLHGPEMAERRRRTREGLKRGKPKAYEALRESGLSMTELRERAGVGKETVRKALYERAGPRGARAIAGVLGEGLPEGDVRALEGELRSAPKKDSRKNFSEGV